MLDPSGSIDVTLPKGVYLAGGTNTVVAKVDTPCGPMDVALSPSRFATLDYERGARSMTTPMRQSLELPEHAKLVRVWIDRSEGSSAKVSLGSLNLDGARGRIDVMWGACAEPRTIAIDGRVLGPLPMDPPPGQQLVLATAPACYRWREVAYSAGTYARGADDVLISRAQMFWVSPLTYFLEEAPATIMSTDAGELRGELQRVDC